MFKLLQLLFLGHAHSWTTVETRTLNYFDEDDGHTTATGTRYILMCKGCGNIKKKDTI